MKSLMSAKSELDFGITPSNPNHAVIGVKQDLTQVLEYFNLIQFPRNKPSSQWC